MATLGGPSLKDTVHSLNTGTIIPEEILISVPSGYRDRIEFILPPNTLIIESELKGQVAQRCFGFQQAKSKYVLQIDDDIILEPDCLEKLIFHLEALPKNAAIAPMFYTLKGKMYAYQAPSRRDTLLAYIANGSKGYAPGKISLSGINFGYTETESSNPVEVEWLAGGCILHHSSSLIKSPFYPFPGKAYAEDLFHSMYLRNLGVQFYLVPEAKIYFDWNNLMSTSFLDEFRVFFFSARALMRYAKADNRNRLLLLSYLFISLITAPFKKWIG